MSNSVARPGSALLVLLLLLVGCGEDEPVAPPPDPGPPPASALETVDLCGPQDDSRGFVRGLLRSGGERAVTDWFGSHVHAPVNIRFCDPSLGEAEIFPRVLSVTVRRAMAGRAMGVIHQDGPSPDQLPLGVTDHSFDVFPEDGTHASDAVGVTISMRGDPP